MFFAKEGVLSESVGEQIALSGLAGSNTTTESCDWEHQSRDDNLRDDVSHFGHTSTAPNAISTPFSTFRTAAMFRHISRLPVGERVSEIKSLCPLICSLQLATLTRGSPRVTSSVLRRLLSSEARAHIQNAIDASPVVLFMKGTPELPQCGFSRAVIQVLDLHGVPPEKIRTYNVLEDPELRSGIKEFSCVMLPKHKHACCLTFFEESGQRFPNFTSSPNLLVDATLSLGVSRDILLLVYKLTPC